MLILLPTIKPGKLIPVEYLTDVLSTIISLLAFVFSLKLFGIEFKTSKVVPV